MDIQIYQPIMLIAANFFVVISGALSHYNQAYNGSILILPADDKMQGPLTLTLSEAHDWCLNNLTGSTLPRIIEDRDSIVQFIQSAVMEQKLGCGQSVLVNSMRHILGNWSWINGFSSKGIEVKGAGEKDKTKHSYYEYLYGYLWTEEECTFYASRPSDARYYICEYVNFTHCPLNISHKCYRMKTDGSTWFQARDKCLQDKGDLASFETLNDKTLKLLFQKLFLNVSKDSYWIGIQRTLYHLDDNGSKINFINWTDDHQANFSDQCLCLQVLPTEVKWIECDCKKSYPFICTLRDTNDSVIPMVSSAETIKIETHCQNTPLAASSHILISSTTELPTHDINRLVGALVACVLIVVVIMVIVIAAVIIRKQRNRPVNSSRSEISTTKTTATTNDYSVYAMIQKPRENQPATNVSTSNTTYATVQVAANFNDDFQMNNIVYADLDLPSKAST